VNSCFGVMSASAPVAPSFNFVYVALMALRANDMPASGKMMIRNPISCASAADIEGVVPFSTMLRRTGQDAISLTAARASSFDVRPSRNATSAPAS
jgi:hypothetical protein